LANDATDEHLVMAPGIELIVQLSRAAAPCLGNMEKTTATVENIGHAPLKYREVTIYRAHEIEVCRWTITAY
jgi:hypothetical protein